MKNYIELELEEYTQDELIEYFAGFRKYKSRLGTVVWKNEDGLFHRELDKPAIIFKTGTAEWYHLGKRHRKGHPAIIHKDGRLEYWENNKHLYTEYQGKTYK